MASGPDQSDILRVLDSGDGSISPDFPQDFWRGQLQNWSISIVSAWIMHSPTPQNMEPL